jgi:hypothetical protein
MLIKLGAANAPSCTARLTMTVIRQKISLLVSVKKKTVLDCRSFESKFIKENRGHVRFGFVVCPLVVDELD